MERTRAFLGIGILLVMVVALGVAACAPAPEPTAAPPAATTAPAEPVATTAPVAPVATTAAVAPTVAVVEEVKVRPIPVLKTPPSNPKAKHGGIYRKLNTQDPPDFGIWDSSVGTTIAPAIPVTDALLDTNEYEQGKNRELLPSLAYDWWTNEAGDRWTFKLREGVKFSDGVTFTCADAKFSLDTIRLGRDATGDELRRSPRGTLIRRVTETRCADDYTLEILTDGPLPSLPATLAHASFAILPKHVYEGNLDLWLKTIGVGLGPFMFDDYRPTEYFRLKRNPDYWNQPYPYLDGFQIINLGSTPATQAAFRVGRSEEGTLPVAVRNQMEKDGKVVVQGKFANDYMRFYQANWLRKPWGDPRFSLAMRCAMDSRKIIDTALDGEGFEGPIFPLAETPGGSEWAITKAEWMAVHPCHGPTAETDMAKRREIARGLLKELGFGPDNPARPSAYSTAGDAVWIPILEDFAAVGIYPVMRTITTAVQYDIQASGDSDILQQGAIDSRRDPDHWLYAHYYSTSDRNYGKYTNAEVDALIDLQSRTLDKAERYKTIHQIEKILLRDNAKIVAQFSLFTRQLSPWVRDSYWGPPTNSQNTGSRYARAWIDQDAKKALGF